MKVAFHHAHLFASDIDQSIRFYREMFGAEVLFDMEMAGARNVMIAVGTGKLNFYDTPPRDRGRGTVHHLGIETDDLASLVKHMERKGIRFKAPIRDFGTWKYVMVEGPDHVLIELFQGPTEGESKEWFRSVSSL